MKTHQKCSGIACNEFSGLHKAMTYTSPSCDSHDRVLNQDSDEFGIDFRQDTIRLLTSGALEFPDVFEGFSFFRLARYLMYRRRLFVFCFSESLCDEICVELLCFPDTDRFADHGIFEVCVEEVFQKQRFSGALVKEVAAGFSNVLSKSAIHVLS